MEDPKLLQKIIDLVPQSIFWKDRDHVYLGCNEHFAKLAGFDSPLDVVGKTDFELSRAEEAESFRADDRVVMESGHSIIEREEVHHQQDGKTAHLLTSKVPLTNAKGHLVGVLGTYADVSTLKQAQEALRQNRNELERVNAQMIEELDRAVLVQQQMLAECAPGCDFLEVDIFQRPLERITGDFYGFRQLPDGSFNFLGADIMGHGISAALFTSLLKVTSQRASDSVRGQPADFVHFLDKELNREIPHGLFTAAAYTFRREDPDTIRFSHCGAAHPPPILYKSATRTWSFLEKGAVAVGLLEKFERIDHHHPLRPGDRVFFYTDGFTESTDTEDQEMGDERFLSLFDGTENQPLAHTKDSIWERLTDPAKGYAIRDDLTLIGFHCVGP